MERVGSSIGRALDCDPSGCGFESRPAHHPLACERKRKPTPDEGRLFLSNLDQNNSHKISLPFLYQRPTRGRRDNHLRILNHHPIYFHSPAVDELARAFDAVDGVNAYEINVSCSHSGALHGNLNVDRDHLMVLLKTLRPATQTPIWVKLAYSTQIVEMALIAEQLGADAIVSTNTIGPGLLLDLMTRRPLLGIKGGAGGVSGHSIFPIALRCVYEISQTVNIPVVGVGGIDSTESTIQMLMAGASAVQLYTAPALRGPSVFRKIVRGLDEYLMHHKRFRTVTDLVGVAHTHVREHVFDAPPPKIIAEKCTGCGKCFASCAFGAIRFKNRGPGSTSLATITNACNGCNACVGMCPPEFSTIERRME